MQGLARQALSERRFAPAAMLFRKAETAWELAGDKCSGSLLDIANQRREQSEIDGYNAQTCAPAFEKAREATQKLRAAAPTASREDKQDALMVAETLWRDVQSVYEGAMVDAARANAQALTRERGTPWVARAAPTALPGPAGALDTVRAAPVAASPAASPATTPPVGSSGAVVNGVVSAGLVPALDFNSGTTRFSGKFVQDPGALTYSGTGKIDWPDGDSYEGSVVKSVRQGTGTFSWRNGQRYSGDWDQGVRQGQGRLRCANGNDYEGQINNGIPHGQGRMLFASGDSYTGRFEQGQVAQPGTYTCKKRPALCRRLEKRPAAWSGRNDVHVRSTLCRRAGAGRPARQGFIFLPQRRPIRGAVAAR